MAVDTYSADPRALPRWGELKHLQPAWYYSALGYVVLMLVYLVASQIDERTLNGISVWSKPFKFALSLAVYFFTLVWFAGFLRRGELSTIAGRTLVAIPVVMAFGELFYITWQAALAEHSHFNTSTPFHALMYSLMGFGAVSMVVVLPWLGVLIARAHRLSDPLICAIVLGLVLTCVLGGGFGGYLSSSDGHWVNGIRSDAQGLWLFNWARDGGDLRVAHFFGMHAMQALPLCAMLLPSAWPHRWRLALVLIFACLYAGLTTLTFIQAVQGQAFLV